MTYSFAAKIMEMNYGSGLHLHKSNMKTKPVQAEHEYACFTRQVLKPHDTGWNLGGNFTLVSKLSLCWIYSILYLMNVAAQQTNSALMDCNWPFCW